jgi:hypothetical protein
VSRLQQFINEWGTGSMSSRNTKVTRDEDGYVTVRLYDTDIVRFNDDEIILNSGRWHTITTKQRMNDASSTFDLEYSVWNKKGNWMVSTPAGEVPYEDGMVIKRT